jgi:hypothetical protein
VSAGARPPRRSRVQAALVRPNHDRDGCVTGVWLGAPGLAAGFIGGVLGGLEIGSVRTIVVTALSGLYAVRTAWRQLFLG